MLTVIVWGAVAIAAISVIAFAILCLGIVRDDRVPGLDAPATGLASWLARRFTGLRVELPAGSCQRKGAQGRSRVSL